MSTVYAGTVFTGDGSLAEAVAVDESQVVAVGSVTEVREQAGSGAEVVECPGLVVPGFVDSHVHLHMHGEAALRADLVMATSWADIRATVQRWADAHPEAPRVLGRAWLHEMLGDAQPTRQLLDEVVPDRPCYLDSSDYHSVWVNTAALREMGLDASTPDPVGGHIHREADGQPSGLLDETALTTIAWPFLARTRTPDDRDRHLRAAVADFHAAGVTSVVDMAVDEDAWASFHRVQTADEPHVRIGGHWLVDASRPLEERLRQVERAAETAHEGQGPLLRSHGIKIIVDGVIDGCTAALSEPYTTGEHPDPIWPYDDLVPVIRAAHEAGIAVAMHAIGDRAVSTALDALETVLGSHPKPHRHRIEHLEYTTPGTAQRCADLGVVVSMQPVHSDPFILPTWRRMLGPERAARGFAWPEFLDAGCTLAFGTDTPTAPHHALPNLWIATTRRSAFDPGLPANNPSLALPVDTALQHSTRTGAFAAGEEQRTGVLAPGLAADLAVLDRNPLVEGPEALLEGKVLRTVAAGRVVHDLL